MYTVIFETKRKEDFGTDDSASSPAEIFSNFAWKHRKISLFDVLKHMKILEDFGDVIDLKLLVFSTDSTEERLNNMKRQHVVCNQYTGIVYYYMEWIIN